MSEEIKTVETVEEPTNEPVVEQIAPENELKYSDKDVDEIVAKKWAKFQKQKEAEVNEAKRLAEMTAQERAEAERDKLQAELNELKAEKNRAQMADIARNILKEKGVNVSDAVVNVLVKDDADETKKAVESFATSFLADVDASVKSKIGGEPPKTGGTPKTLTRADIEAVANREERQKLIRENIELFQ